MALVSYSVKLPAEQVSALKAIASAQGSTHSSVARAAIEAYVASNAEAVVAPLTRRAVFEVLDGWLSSARMQKEWAADDLMLGLEAGVRSDLYELRELLAANILLCAQIASDLAGEGEEGVRARLCSAGLYPDAP